MNFKEQLIQNVITPNMSNKLSNAIGQVIEYDSNNNVASVFVKSLNGKENYNLDKVPVQLSGSGVHSAPLSYGDMVYIQFNNNSIFQPKIIGFADECYQINTMKKEKHLRKGSLITTQDVIEGDIKPSYKNWLNYEESYDKYISYRYENPVKNISELMDKKGYFNNNEVGIYNTKSSAIVKIKDNGVIDIFTSTNIGIRVNPSNKTIEMFGDVSTKSNNWSVLSNNIEIKASENISISSKNIEISSDNIVINGEKF